VRRWLLPALALASIAVALAAATANAGDRKDHHGDRNKSSQQSSTTSSTLCGLDVVYLQTSIQGDRYEIAAGTLALQKTKNPQVTELAKTLVKDHSKSLQDAIDLAKKLGIDVPTEPTPTQQWQIEELREYSGAAFDHDFSELDVLDHQQDISDAQNEVKMGCNEDVRSDAAKEIPTLQYHLKLSQEALASASQENSSH